jgi:hypothetical protein
MSFGKFFEFGYEIIFGFLKVIVIRKNKFLGRWAIFFKLAIKDFSFIILPKNRIKKLTLIRFPKATTIALVQCLHIWSTVIFPHSAWLSGVSELIRTIIDSFPAL